MSLGIFTAVVVSPISEKMSLTSLLWSEARDTRNLSIARLWFLTLFLLFVFVVGFSGLGQSEIGQRLHFARERLIARVSSDYHLLGYSLSPLTWRSESNKSTELDHPAPNCQPPILMSLTLDRESRGIPPPVSRDLLDINRKQTKVCCG